jgi:hypothetical protein
MQLDRIWLDAHGGLHDARVLSVTERAERLIIEIDDEWASEHGGDDPPIPGSITLQEFSIIEGTLIGLENGWISEVHVGDAGAFKIDFCDRDRLVILAHQVFWMPR